MDRHRIVKLSRSWALVHLEPHWYSLDDYVVPFESDPPEGRQEKEDMAVFAGSRLRGRKSHATI